MQQQDQQLAEIMEKEMTHHEQVSVLSHMYLQQVEEVKAHSQEIRQLLALVEQQQKAIENLSSPHNPPRELRAVPSCSETQLDAMREEVFNIIPGTVNTMRGAAVLHNTSMASAPMVNQNSFEDILAEEANFTPSHLPNHVTFMDTMRGVLPHPHPTDIKKRWSYHQDPLKVTTQKKLDSMQLPTNLEKCRSPN